VRVAATDVTPGLLEALVVFDPGEPLRTSEVPGLASAALAALPGLKGHRCRNGAGLGFVEEIEDTELAHLIEHATLEIMAMAGSPDTLRGATKWDFEGDGPGAFRVSVAWDDDLVALGSLRFACALVGALARGQEPPDAVAEAQRLRGLRRK
jgi:hypothetical protein